MSLGGGMPRIPKGGTPRIPKAAGGGGAARMPRVRDPRTAARSAVSRNPLVRAWQRLRSNRLLRMLTPGGKGAGGKGPGGKGGSAAKGDAATAGATSTAVDTSSSSASSRAPSLEQTHSQGTPVVEPAGRTAAPTVREPAPHHRPGPGARRSERRRARRAARRAAPRVSRAARRRLRRMDGVLSRSLLEVGRAQWGAAFDTGGLDPRFIRAFDRQLRVLVTVPRPDGDRRRVLGRVEVEGFAPEGDAVVSIDPAEGRLAMRPEFRIRSEALSGPIPVTADMHLEGLEEPNGRFVVRSGLPRDA